MKPRQKLFVEAYTDPTSASFGNAAGSARAAGYSGKGSTLATTAQRLLRDLKPAIDAAHAVHAEQRREESEAAAKEFTVLQTLRDFQELYQTAKANGELGPAIKAKELIGKHLRMFTDRIEVDDVTGKSEADLRAEIKELMAELDF